MMKSCIYIVSHTTLAPNDEYQMTSLTRHDPHRRMSTLGDGDDDGVIPSLFFLL
jgi:hypothetical protein